MKKNCINYKNRGKLLRSTTLFLCFALIFQLSAPDSGAVGKAQNSANVGFSNRDLSRELVRPIELFDGYDLLSYKSFDVLERDEKAVRLGDDNVNIVASYYPYASTGDFEDLVDGFYDSADVIYLGRSLPIRKKKSAYVISDDGGRERKAVHVMSRSNDWALFYHALLLDEGDRALIIVAHGTAYPETKPYFATFVSVQTLRSLRINKTHRLRITD